VVQSHGPYADIITHYYAEQKIVFNLFEDIRTKSFDECEAQRADVEVMFNSSPNPPVFSFCGAPMIASRWEQDILFLNDMSYRRLDTFEKYKTFAECRTALPGLQTKYAAQLKKDVKGAACSNSIKDAQYRALLFYQ